MTDDQSQYPQREVQRLTAELARKEYEIEELKKMSSRTKKVEDAFWSHEIFLKARNKLFAGVGFVVAVFGAFGYVSFDELYERGLKFVDGEMKTQIANRITKDADDMVEEAKMDMDKQISDSLRDLIAAKKKEIETQMAEAQTTVAATLDQNILEAKGRVTDLVAIFEQDIKVKIGEMETAIKMDADAVSNRVKQMRIAMLPQADPKRVDSEITQSCDPNYLDDAQIARVGVRQLSEATGKSVRNRLQVFENTFFLDVRTTDETTDAAEPSCILDGVDRVVYGADPKWYSPSEFVRIDRENEFRFTISGWGPTELSAQVYFIGRRDPETFSGNLTMIEVARADEKKYLGDAPQEFR